MIGDVAPQHQRRAVFSRDQREFFPGFTFGSELHLALIAKQEGRLGGAAFVGAGENFRT
jgi:hypothetical protein